MRPDELPIPTPCHADWNSMEVRDRARFCQACSLEVLDVSARTEAEARSLLATPRTGRVCVSYVVRPDGTLRLTKDAKAPDVPLGALRRRGASMVVAASLALAACGGTRLAGAPVPTSGAVVAPSTPDASPETAPTTPEGKPSNETNTPIAPCDPDETDQRIRGELVAPTPPPAGDVRIQGGLRRVE